MAAFRRFEKWASPIKVLTVFPTSDIAVSIYLLSLKQMGKSAATVVQFISAASLLHRTAGYEPPTNSNIVRTVREGAKRMSSKPTTPKEPITPEILGSLMTSLYTPNRKLSLYSLMLMAFTLLCYAAFLRFNEASHLRREDNSFHATYVVLFIQKSKTDMYMYHEGRTINLCRDRHRLGPVCYSFQVP